MFSDRQYKRRRQYSPPGRGSDDGMKTVFILIGICVVMFFLTAGKGGQKILEQLALSVPGLKNMKIWQLITYMFLHGGFAHILFNMWGLYLFGSIVAPKLGSGRFLKLFFISGLSAAGLWIAFNWDSPIPMVGASGALFGVLVASAMLAPNVQLMLLIPPVPLKLKNFVLIYGGLEIFFMMGEGGGSNIAHLAHLGGIAGGYVYMKYFYRQYSWDPLAKLLGGKKGNSPSFGFKDKFKDIFNADERKSDGWSLHSYDKSYSEKYDKKSNVYHGHVSQKEIDYLLDKISKDGINSLNDEELAKLRKARRQMKR